MYRDTVIYSISLCSYYLHLENLMLFNQIMTNEIKISILSSHHGFTHAG